MNAHTHSRFDIAHRTILSDPQTEAVIRELGRFVELAGRGVEARIGSLRGPSRVGKSTLVRKFRAMHPPESVNGIRIQPIIAVKVPGTPTIKGVLTECLEALGAKSLPRDTAPQLVRRLKHYIKECGVRLIVLDEFQHFHEVRGVSQTGLYDTVKSILNECRCPILAVGVENSIDVILADPQLDGRCIYRRELKPFLPPEGYPDQQSSRRPVPISTFSDFQNVAYQLFTTCEMQVDDEVLVGETGRLLFGSCGGLYGKLVDIVVEAAFTAEERGQARITSTLLREVIDRISGDPRRVKKTELEEAVAQTQAPGSRPKRRKGARMIARIEEGIRRSRRSAK
jgi:hypothetical protein